MKLDLNILKGEIERKKQEIDSKNIALGFEGAPKPKNFLNGLVKAYNTMRETDETKTIKKIVDKSDIIAPIDGIDKHIQPPKRPIQTVNNYNDDEDDRFNDAIMDRVNNFKSNQNLNMNDMYPNIPSNNIYQNNQMMYNEPIKSDLTEEIIMKTLYKIIGGDMDKTFNGVVANMLMSEKISEAINQNKELIRSIVIDVIRDLKKKK